MTEKSFIGKGSQAFQPLLNAFISGKKRGEDLKTGNRG